MRHVTTPGAGPDDTGADDRRAPRVQTLERQARSRPGPEVQRSRAHDRRGHERLAARDDADAAGAGGGERRLDGEGGAGRRQRLGARDDDRRDEEDQAGGGTTHPGHYRPLRARSDSRAVKRL
jgi:hypothetical protein